MEITTEGTILETTWTPMSPPVLSLVSEGNKWNTLSIRKEKEPHENHTYIKDLKYT